MSKLLLKYKCPECGENFKTTKFCIHQPDIMKQGEHIFHCPHCNTELTISKKLYKYINMFIYYFFTVFMVGFITSFFVDKVEKVTIYMLFSFIPIIPIFILMVINNKAIKTHNK